MTAGPSPVLALVRAGRPVYAGVGGCRRHAVSSVLRRLLVGGRAGANAAGVVRVLLRPGPLPPSARTGRNGPVPTNTKVTRRMLLLARTVSPLGHLDTVGRRTSAPEITISSLVLVVRLMWPRRLRHQVRDLLLQLSDHFSQTSANASGTRIRVLLGSLPPARSRSPGARPGGGGGVLARIPAWGAGPAPRQKRQTKRFCNLGCRSKPGLQHLSPRLHLGHPRVPKVACLFLARSTSLRLPVLQLVVLPRVARRRQLALRGAGLRGWVVLVPVLGFFPAGVCILILLHFLFKGLVFTNKTVALSDKILNILLC